jgi:cyclopropane-fatty-acyl-phospholipid synthase
MPLADLLARVAGDTEGALRVEAYDGSVAGAESSPATVRIVSPRALGHLLRAPGGLGLGRAYVLGDLDVDGDMYTALAALSSVARERIGPAERRELLRLALRSAGSVIEARPPDFEVRRLHGRRHTKGRDAAAISHHYDVSNRFYEIVLGPSMAYTCAVYPSDSATLEQAQAEKFDLVCRKLGLEPGMRLLDVGCGWGGMVVHAAQHYGVTAVGVTLSRQQAEYGAKRVAEAGVAERAKVLHLDYRDAPGDGYDAISSIGLTEHIGRKQLPGYFARLHAKLRPGGRLLNHCIMRPDTKAPATVRRGFINRYVFPDGELTALGPIVAEMQDSGFDVRHEENLREHYAKTLTDWCANLDRNWDAALAEVGPVKARVWRLYMTGSRLGFERNEIQLHQVLGTRPDDRGRSFMPLRPTW